MGSDWRYKCRVFCFCAAFGFDQEEVIGSTSDELNLQSSEEKARLLPIILDYLKEETKGYDKKELESLTFEDKEKLFLKLKSVDEKKGFEVNYTMKNGGIFSSIVCFEIIQIENKKYIITSYPDISGRKKAEEDSI